MPEIIAFTRLLLSVLKESFVEWWADDSPRLAAALAFYTVMSLAPLMVIAIAMAGAIFGQAAAQGEVIAHTKSLIGGQAASIVQTVIEKAWVSRSGFFASTVSIGLLLLTATIVFADLQHALNRVWEVQSKGSLRGVVRTRLLSFLMVLGVGLLLLAALLFNAGLALLARYLGSRMPGISELFFLVNVVLPFIVITVLFAMFYEVLPDVNISWKDVWVGALITAFLFIIGKYLLGFYLGRETFGSAYGAAGSLFVFLIWLYYSAQIFLLGAEITHVYARRFGTRITPARGAVPLLGGKKAGPKVRKGCEERD